LIDSAGIVVFESNLPQDSLRFVENHLWRPEVQIALQAGIGRAERLSATVHQRLFYAVKKVRLRGAKTGLLDRVCFIRLAISLVTVEQALEEIRWNIFVSGGVALLLIGLVSYWASSKLAAPIQDLARVAESVKKGDWEAHFKHYSDDEIGELADLLNEMLAKLRDDLKQMRKLETMRTQFLGNVSHELRTPIFAVQGYLETLLEGKVENEQTQKSFLEKTYRQAERLNNLLTDLIDISRIESGEM
jgi:signal transduction histidine kinase